MGEEEPASLDGQFFEFAKMMDKKRDGTTITLYNSDFWMRQCKLLDDRKVTMTDTGILFNKFSKSELDWDEWNEFLTELCEVKELDEEKVRDTLTNCGLPGQSPVLVPQYRDFFLTYKPKEKTLF
ncbi:tubulin polymerization-promoting protein homolog [Vanessa tameamea]|uniref:Tubulin polymerization-promoting protein homolog n=1 Tax=Vanessa tameamea TaxID=334116 RepID=A0A8B8HZT1_VANTA|nr:TPPP family protein CG45057-like [Vanessa tameamea]XP_047544061.1 tubulin polymerization-promoting protein homolog [Vanessa atalanta]